MATVQFVYTTSAKMNDLPVEDGQIIFVPELSTIAMDLYGQRFYYQMIKSFDTDAQRIATPFPIIGFYWVEETETLWRWNQRWTKVSSSNDSSVVEAEKEEDFPQEGVSNTLYYTDDGIYRWKNSSDKYNLIANANTWESISD